MRGAFENEQWKVAVVLIVMIVEGELLLPMRGIIGVVYIEDNGWGRLRVTRNKVVDQGQRETIEVFAVYLVFQTGEGGSTGFPEELEKFLALTLLAPRLPERT